MRPKRIYVANRGMARSDAKVGESVEVEVPGYSPIVGLAGDDMLAGFRVVLADDGVWWADVDDEPLDQGGAA